MSSAPLVVHRVEALPAGGVRVHFTARTDAYYILYEALVPKPIDRPVAVNLGGESFGSIEHLPADLPSLSRFYRLGEVIQSTPLDLDGDGIDDVYELRHPQILNPLDGADAVLDPDGDGRSHLRNYLAERAARPRLNDEPPAGPQEAISREVSLYNFGRPARREAISREISLFNLGRPIPPNAISREISLFNFGPTVGVEAISREFSVFNFGPTNGVEAISRELSLFNFGNTNVTEAISREVSVQNGNPPQP